MKPAAAPSFRASLGLGRAFASVAWVLIFPVGFAAAVMLHSLFWLDWVHVMGALLWTAIDIFMGLVLGPVLQRVHPAARQEVVSQLMPRMLFLMPILAITVGFSGWTLGHWLGHFPPHQAPAPAIWAIGAITVILTVEGLGGILPINYRVFQAGRQAVPPLDTITRLVKLYRVLVTIQAVLQFALILLMVHLAVS
ncbi:hypothetical protein Sulac_0121 [Sulfobacillus acidophilus DSM 10332]|uniref:DUF4149 domain-containing protein n=1 Tax=Sulfobacillus acidophilus (strain ATCC 700253 / DSM 10332 / NAL) TaxID=679936 RepID=G8TVQ5_SULAD|nr:hypothetical protein Sulac_0121 [Sulfobacillus acidophilus DSM 10332]